MLISGFNTLSKEEQGKYDKAKLSRDMVNSFVLWTGIFLVGGILSYFISKCFAVLAFIVWIILFFKDVHVDTDKAFGKYKK